MTDLESLSTAHSSSDVDHEGPVPLHNESQDNQGTGEQLKTSTTRASILTDTTLRRPRDKRRGLLAQFSLVPEFKDARDYPDGLKNFIVFVIAIAAMIGPMGTSIVFPAIEDMKKDLNTTTMMVNVSVGIYLLSLGIFPIWWSSFSEMLGRRTVYVLSFTLYIGFAIGCALSPSIGALTGFRVLSGACSASVQSVGAGTISDIYAPEQRGRGMGYFYLGALASPLISPIVGALLLIRWSWRSTQWFLVVLAALMDLLIILCLPETLRTQNNKDMIAKILAERRTQREKISNEDKESNIDNDGNDQSMISRVTSIASAAGARDENAFVIDIESTPNPDPAQLQATTEADIRRQMTEIEEAIEEEESNPSRWKRVKRALYIYGLRPLKSVYFFGYPPVALSISFSAITFGVLYVMNMTIEYEYARAPYNWKALYVGFAYIPNSVTYIIASIYGGRWTDWLLKRYRAKNGFNAPEARISYNMLSAVIAYPPALLIAGWCFHYHTHWVTPLIGTAIFGFATMMTIGPTATYLVDSLPGRGATGMALNNLVRQTFATGAVFLVDPMIVGMGTGPMMSMCCGVVLVWSVVLIILKKKGAKWREEYDLQKFYDKLE
ncbi:CYFA0S23e00672g1_1 [Cyberlindnera fabianii]|uniref:CYFA0S23e00672g1_1 n=1 Tax=Cyberlindnera fabianii TaxID=36022 RepID=A0A061BET1_CYBFA|nr:Quinidine resistance protein 3 [Cyberlindnera fabianii]CDR46406.1 CYFA0S23e00672g1_1 [Cyberlindnera fabianii]